MARVISLFVRHGVDKYVHGERDMVGLFSQHLPKATHEILVLDNALPPTFSEPTSHNRKVIGGDNSFWEFSAWDKGIASLGEEIYNYDYVHLATSAFNTLYTAYLHRITDEVLAACSGKSVCIGHVDCYNEAVELGNFRSQHWLRSCYLFFPPYALRALGSLVSWRDPDLFFSDDYRHPFRDDAPISPNYQHYITSWLTGDGTGQGTEWHSKFQLNEDTFPLFKAKTLAILNEHTLSMRLRAQGTKILDATWLGSGNIGAIDSHVSWRTQLRTRSEAPVVVE